MTVIDAATAMKLATALAAGPTELFAVLSGLFTAESGITLPVSFARSDLATLALLFGFAALLAALPAVLAYRQSPAAALRA